MRDARSVSEWVRGTLVDSGLQNGDPENNQLCSLNAKYRHLTVALGDSVQIHRVGHGGREIRR